MKPISARQAEALRLRDEGLTLREVGLRLGVTRERVRVLAAVAKTKLDSLALRQARCDEPPITIADLALSTRAHNALVRGGIATVDELCERTDNDLLRLRMLGRRSLTDIKERLAVHGRALASLEKHDTGVEPLDVLR